MDRAGVAALRSSAERDHIPLVEMRPLSMMIEAILERIGAGLPQGGRPAAIINVGGALIGLGTCRESYELPPGWVHMTSCSEGAPGVAFRLASSGAPMLNMINFRRLAIESGLPFDPSPLPSPGNNLAVYGLKRGSF